MTSWKAGVPAKLRGRLKEADHPRWVEPMLATLTDERFSREGWIFERKLDGERCLGFRCGSTVRLLSRNRKDLHATYPEVADALGSQGVEDFVVDGEAVAFFKGRTSFSRLQRRMQIEDEDEARSSGVAVFYYLFDLLHLDGHDLTALPLRERKKLLKKALRYRRPLRFTPHRNERGESFYREACEKGWEGVIAKDATSEYVHSRSRKWLKFKCVHRQEFVIGGYTDPEGSRTGFGALLVGYYEGEKLRYAGKVGTGFDDETLENLSESLASLETDVCPFAGEEAGGRGVHFVRPERVGEVGFTEWTDQGKLRHPRFLGLRRDKDPRDVVRESGG